MNLLISEQGEVLGQTLSPENAHRIAMVSRTPMFVVTEPKDFSSIPKDCVRALNQDYGAKSFRALWAMVSKRHHPNWGKVSVMAVIRHLYSEVGFNYSQSMLLKLVPGGTWVSITTAFSMLKNDKYNDGKPMVIEQDANGQYERTK